MIFRNDVVKLMGKIGYTVNEKDIFYPDYMHPTNLMVLLDPNKMIFIDVSQEVYLAKNRYNLFSLKYNQYDKNNKLDYIEHDEYDRIMMTPTIKTLLSKFENGYINFDEMNSYNSKYHPNLSLVRNDNYDYIIERKKNNKIYYDIKRYDMSTIHDIFTDMDIDMKVNDGGNISIIKDE